MLAATGAMVWTMAWAQQPEKPLQQMTPLSAYSRRGREVRPQPAGVRSFHGQRGETLELLSDTEFTYAVPSGTASFTALAAFTDFLTDSPDSELAGTRLLVRVLVDGKPALSFAMDHQTPLLRFVAPVAGARQLTISSAGEGNPNPPFYLMNAGFSAEAKPQGISHILAPGEAYVAVASEARQQMYHVYFPGEAVAVSVASGSALQSAEVRLRLSPPQNQFTPVEFRATVPLHANDTGGCEGTVAWRVPDVRGPAQLEVTAGASGTILYREQRPVAVVPRSDPAGIVDSVFGMHSSTAGFLLPYDEFVSMWGAKWARLYLQWPVSEAQPGKYDFQRTDELIDAYRSQNMKVLAVLGERAPSWAGKPGPEYDAAWAKWVAATVSHLKGKVDAWDLFNEIDVKYYRDWYQADPDADLGVLRAGAAAVRAADPQAMIVCCSTGTYNWLNYDDHIFGAGLLKQFDAVSLHPYMVGAPEDKDWVFDFPGKLSALDQLERQYGEHKPMWATEAAWNFIGSNGKCDTACAPDGPTQAMYVARVLLLSAALEVPYFLQASRLRLQPDSSYGFFGLETVSAYANAASLLSSMKGGGRKLTDTPGVWAIAWNTREGVVGALWTERETAEVEISGIPGARFLDLYGNRIVAQAGSLRISPSPVYFVAKAGASPEVAVRQAPPPLHWTAVPPLRAWQRRPAYKYSAEGESLRIVAGAGRYGNLLQSQSVPVQPDTCYLLRMKFQLNRGGVSLYASDPEDPSQRLEDATTGLYSRADGQPKEAVVRFRTRNGSQVKIMVGANNPYDEGAVTDAILFTPALATCSP
jgi:hypothetical protein